VPLRRMECDAAGFSRFKHEEEIGSGCPTLFCSSFMRWRAGNAGRISSRNSLRAARFPHLAHERAPSLAEGDALKNLLPLVCGAAGHLHNRAHSPRPQAVEHQ